MREGVGAGRAGETDALPAGAHFRAIAAFADAGIWRIRGGEKPARRGQGLARRRLRNGLGVSAQARDSQEGRGSALAERQKATFSATGGLLNHGNGEQVRWLRMEIDNRPLKQSRVRG